jgi:hypothetical protein
VTTVDISTGTATTRGFFCHHKTASTWGRIIISEVGAALDLKVRTIMSPQHWAGYPSAGDMVRAERPGLIVVTDPRPELMATLPAVRGFHVIRDPRDILVSSYFSHRNSHPVSFGGVEWPELVPHREALLRLDHDAGILKEMEFSGWMIDTMATWDYQRPGMLEIRMEDLTADPVTWWSKIFRHLELLAGPGRLQVLPLARIKWNLAVRRERPRSLALLRGRLGLGRVPIHRLSDSYVAWALDRFSFERLAGGRAKGEEDQGSHYRRGVAGDWRNHLTEAHLAAFRERFGDLTGRLGYQP